MDTTTLLLVALIIILIFIIIYFSFLSKKSHTTSPPPQPDNIQNVHPQKAPLPPGWDSESLDNTKHITNPILMGGVNFCNY